MKKEATTIGIGIGTQAMAILEIKVLTNLILLAGE